MTILTLIAFDIGLKRTGVAIGNTLTQIATPLKVVSAGNKKDRLTMAKALISEWHVNMIVVGIPYYPDGKPHDMTRAALNFAKQVQHTTQLPIWLVDERYSSAIEGVETDADAAAVILQQYFDEGGILLK